MKLNIEEYLHRIDTAFADKEQKEIYMIYIMIVAAIFSFAYLLFWDSSFEGFEKTRAKVATLQQQITADEYFLRANPAAKIAQIEQQIKRTQEEIIDIKDTNAYIKSKIETIAFLIYDERVWGEYLDSIATNAQKFNVKILQLDNEYAKGEKSFGHILNINIETQGDFKNSLKFINSLEQSDLVVDIHDFDLKAQEALNGKLKISVWGIRY